MSEKVVCANVDSEVTNPSGALANSCVARMCIYSRATSTIHTFH